MPPSSSKRDSALARTHLRHVSPYYACRNAGPLRTIMVKLTQEGPRLADGRFDAAAWLDRLCSGDAGRDRVLLERALEFVRTRAGEESLAIGVEFAGADGRRAHGYRVDCVRSRLSLRARRVRRRWPMSNGKSIRTSRISSPKSNGWGPSAFSNCRMRRYLRAKRAIKSTTCAGCSLQ